LAKAAPAAAAAPRPAAPAAPRPAAVSVPVVSALDTGLAIAAAVIALAAVGTTIYVWQL
jgi:uncharacterized membrane protein (DUF485 family)